MILCPWSLILLLLCKSAFFHLRNASKIRKFLTTETTKKYIGVVLDDSMSMAPPITAVCKSIFFHLRNASKIRKFLTTETTKTLLHAFVTSKLDYCNSLLNGAPKYLLHRLQQVLNCTARIVYQSKKYDYITPLLTELHWPPIKRRINFKILLITIKVLHNQAPTYLTDLLTYYQPRRLLCSSAKKLALESYLKS